MMLSIFSTFDTSLLPTSNKYITIIMMIAPSLLFTQMFWITPSTRLFALKFLLHISKLLNMSTKSKFLTGALSLITPMFYILTTMNMAGALPYLPSLTSHLVLTISSAMPLWATMIFINLTTKMKSLKSHMLPENAPTPIATFLTSVESLSCIIRPITLSFRLAANISAGHVILGMMSVAFSFTIIMLTSLAMILLITLGSGYASFELIICLVQAFVFILLTNMYTSDHLYTRQSK